MIPLAYAQIIIHETPNLHGRVRREKDEAQSRRAGGRDIPMFISRHGMVRLKTKSFPMIVDEATESSRFQLQAP
jgi:hypothetical protein